MRGRRGHLGRAQSARRAGSLRGEMVRAISCILNSIAFFLLFYFGGPGERLCLCVCASACVCAREAKKLITSTYFVVLCERR